MGNTTLAEVLRGAREKREWSFTRAAKVLGVGEQTLRNLERTAGATRPGDPGAVSTRTLARIVEGYWPDVQLEHFDPQTRLRFTARDRRSLRRLKGYRV